MGAVGVLSALLAVLAPWATCAAAGVYSAIAGVKTTYRIVKEGTGSAVVQNGDHVKVHATGIVSQTGKKFWSTKDTNDPFSYTAGQGVIKGWAAGGDGMKL